MKVTLTQIKLYYNNAHVQTCSLGGHKIGNNIPVWNGDPWYVAPKADFRNINYQTSSSAGSAFPTAFPTAKPTAYPTTKPTAYPTPAPTGILAHNACKATICTYTNGRTFVSTNTLVNEKWHCEKVGNGCKCVCHSSLHCALRHHHVTGYRKTFEHC